MTQEQKELLLKDLCGRLYYGIFVKENRESLDDEPTIYTLDYHPCIDSCKPYLRPLSSMTEEEKMELYIRAYAPDEMKTLDKKLYVIQTNAKNATDFYNEHHFDYRGLIPMGLALEAPEDMYKI